MEPQLRMFEKAAELGSKHEVTVRTGKNLYGFYVEVSSGNFRDVYRVTAEGATWKDSRTLTSQKVTPQGDDYHLRALNAFSGEFVGGAK